MQRLQPYCALKTVLTTRTLIMAAESLSPVALNSKTLATGPLQQKHVWDNTSLFLVEKKYFVKRRPTVIHRDMPSIGLTITALIYNQYGQSASCTTALPTNSWYTVLTWLFRHVIFCTRGKLLLLKKSKFGVLPTKCYPIAWSVWFILTTSIIE